MKCLVVGCGSIGERHIGNLKKVGVKTVYACDTDKKRLDIIKKKYDAMVFDELKKAFQSNPELVFVCTPPSSHISIAMEAIENGAHVFIEKPMSDSIDRIDELLTKAKEKKLLIFVGYNFRFEKGMQLVKKIIAEKKIGRVYFAKAEFGQYLPNWRPWQDYTKSYTSLKSLGGGIILDGSHELDYMRWLMGNAESVSCFADKISDLKVETEDVAEILVRFENDAICNVHLDFVRQGYSRNCEIVGEKGAVIWDFAAKVVKTYYIQNKKWETIEISSDVNDMYIEEIKHVIKTIEGGGKPLVDGYEGKKTLELALAAKNSAETNKLVKM